MTVAAMTLSVVIPTRRTTRELAACLAALAAQSRPPDEVLVAAAAAEAEVATVVRPHPWARLIAAPCAASLAELRGAALARAAGDLVAFTDVYCRPAPDWVARLHAAPWEGYAAVGGVVAPAPRPRATDWAIFLCEYAAHVPGLPGGPATILPGNNVAFRRDILACSGLIGEREFWKAFAVQRLLARGERCFVDPALVVQHERHMPALTFLRQRYLHGRCYGANLTAGRSTAYKLARATGCPLVPALLTARLARAVWPARAYRPRFCRGLASTLIFQTGWAVGECLGYLAGDGGAGAQAA